MPQIYYGHNNKKEMRNTILATAISLLVPVLASAQFHTVTKSHPVNHCFTASNHGHDVPKIERMKCSSDTTGKAVDVLHDGLYARKGDGHADIKTAGKKHEEVTKPKFHQMVGNDGKLLPELTISNLYKEIVRNGILYPEIVLAQAILETGWFRSSLCRDRNNLFGLTNPRTGKYFEFGHWTESVRAYYTKVQYKYKGGNYLLWLRKIGYAEDPNYVRSVIKVLRMLQS